MAAPPRSRLLSATGTSGSRDKLVSQKLVLREMINAHVKVIPELVLHVTGQNVGTWSQEPEEI